MKIREHLPAVGSAIVIVSSLFTLSLYSGWHITRAGAQELVKAEVQQQVGALNDTVVAIALGQLTSDLMTARRYQCEAIAAGDQARKATYATLMQELKVRYLKLAKVAWDQPACGEI